MTKLKHERLDLSSQINYLKESLLKLPGSDWFNKSILETRIQELEERLSTLPVVDNSIVRAHVVLTFKGQPVRDTSGIEIDFASKALSVFDEVVASFANDLLDDNNQLGRTANRAANKLFVTARALGSFGFVLEEMPEPADSQGIMDEDKRSIVAQAVDETTRILSSIEKTEEDEALFGECASKASLKTINKIKEYLDLLTRKKAVFTLKSNDKFRVEYRSTDAIVRASTRLCEHRLIETEKNAVGYIRFLDHSRRFELTFTQPNEGFQEQWVSGKISSFVSAEQLAHLDALLLAKTPIEVFLTERMVTGKIKETRTYRLDRWVGMSD